MFQIEIHPEAIANFNTRAEELISLLIIEKQDTQKKIPLSNPFHVVDQITDEDFLSEPRISTIDILGRELEKIFIHKKQRYVLRDQGLKKLHTLAEDIYRKPTVNDRISKSLITDVIWDWIKAKIIQARQDDVMSVLVETCAEQVRDVEVWIPIACLCVQSEYDVGCVKIRSLSKDVLDKWMSCAIKERADIEEQIKLRFDKLRGRYQGYASGVIQVNAEPIRASQIAREKVETALAGLRVFSAAALFPDVICNWVPSGWEYIPENRSFQCIDGVMSHISEGLSSMKMNCWPISNSEFDMMLKAGLEKYSVTVESCQKSKFEKDAIRAIRFYSRSLLLESIGERLTFIFASLESLLLKGETEPTSQNIADRVAFFLGKTPEQLRAISANIKKAYVLRGKFIHHGRTLERNETLDSFFRTSWDFYTQLMQNLKTFKTREDFIRTIEDRKYQ